jgi:hypothetical protein
MTDEGVVVLGIPIPSSSPLFLSIVAVHVAAGITCTAAGIVAMLAPKRSSGAAERHSDSRKRDMQVRHAVKALAINVTHDSVMQSPGAFR